MKTKEFTQFMQFLQDDLAIPEASLQLALRYSDQTPSLLPMILWQYGLVTLADVNRIFDWMEHQISG